MQIIKESHINTCPLISRGKVRDIYAIDDNTLLIVTTDRMSAFDVIMAETIPYKGVVLNQISIFWIKHFEHIIANHLIETDVNLFPDALTPYKDILEGRSVLVKRAKPIPLECIVRGYLSGSAWEEYKERGTVCGKIFSAGLKESAKLEEPIFTPSTKADIGEHDENISLDQAAKLVGEDTLKKLEEISLEIFKEASSIAQKKGIIIADTKFEFGFINGEIILIDEVLTPDSSRFWPAAGYAPGKAQPSFDKQYLRDWLLTQNWDKQPPAPPLPEKIRIETTIKYREAYEMLTGKTLAVHSPGMYS